MTTSFEQQKVVLGLCAFACGMDRADEDQKMCIESNEFEKQKIVPGVPTVAHGVDRAEEKKMYIRMKPQPTTLSQSMASSSNSPDHKDPENLSDDEFEEQQIVQGSPAVEEMCIGR
ncbi:hypothetical protein Tco_0089010 [Tanacetum coccineum]